MESTPNRKLLCICENPHEAQSLLLVAEKLSELSEGKVVCEFASLDGFLFQGVDAVLKEAGVAYLTLAPIRSLIKPLTEYGLFYNMLNLLENQRRIASLVDSYDGIFCGIDLFLVRILIFEAQRQHKPTFQLYGTLHFEVAGTGQKRPPLVRFARALGRRLLVSIFRAEFLRAPGLECQSGCDRVFVMGEHVKRALVSQGVKGVIVSGTPRFSKLFTEQTEVHGPGEWQDKFVVLYLPGSFAWHGDLAWHKRQQEQLHQIVELLEEMPNNRYHLVIKNHPREKEEYYAWLRRRSDVSFFPHEADLYQLIRQSDVVMSMISLSIFEAIALKRAVIVTDFPVDRSRDNQLRALKRLPVVDTAEELGRLLESLRTDRAEYRSLLTREKQSLDDFIAPHTPRAAEIIATEILQIMGCIE